MKYEPIKNSLGKVFNRTPFLRIIFYNLLDLLLLRAWHVKRELKKNIKNLENASVLDAGCGFAQYTYFMSTLNNNCKIEGVEINKTQVDDNTFFFTKIGKSGRVSFAEGDLTKFSKPLNYNFVLSVDVMEHIEDDVQVFSNFYASLKPGGIVVISTPSDQGGSDAHDEHEESFIGEHVRNGYNINEIQEKLKKAGFSKTEARYTYGTPGNISWKLSMKYPISLLGVSKLFFILLPFYYLITFPISFILNYFDLLMTHKSGTGLLVKAVK